MVTLTERAAKEVRQIIKEKGLAEGTHLRLGVSGGGCSGFEYVLDFTDAPTAEDGLAESQGLRIAIDPKAQMYLKGLNIDFNDDLLNRGFKFTNPNATGTCGCGTSFSV